LKGNLKKMIGQIIWGHLGFVGCCGSLVVVEPDSLVLEGF
jgi:hypothetical protein